MVKRKYHVEYALLNNHVAATIHGTPRDLFCLGSEMIIHYGKCFKKIAKESSGYVKLYESVCRKQNIPYDQISYTATKVSCVPCLLAIRARRESEIRSINISIMDIRANTSVQMEIAI